MLDGVGPVEVASFLPLLRHLFFEDIGLVYARDKLRDFIVVGDVDLVLLGIVLSSCEFTGVGADMLAGGVSTGGDEGDLCRYPFRVDNYGPRAEVIDERKYGFVTVPEVVHLFFFCVLWHDGGDNCGSPVENDGFL